ncbi:MAG TPA: ATP-binding protein [Bacteroidales bacterium]|nr:ATP-binding protein [Bacteroidales bacterium]
MKSCYKYLILSLLCLIIGVLTQHNILFPRFNHAYAKRFQQVFAQKENETYDIIKPLADSAAKNAKTRSGNVVDFKYNNLLKEKGLAVFVYQRDTLRYWSDNLVPISTRFSQSGIDSSFIYIKNAWFVPRVVRKNNTVVVGLILIKQVYQYENKLLETKFHDDFAYPPSVKIASKVVANSFPIVDRQGNYLFSLVFDESVEYPFYENTLPSICYILFFLFFLWFGFRFIQSIENPSLRRKTIFAFAIFVCGLKVYMIYNQIPKVFYSEKIPLFNPLYFASSEIMPSLGDLLIWAIIIMYFVLVFDICYDLSSVFNKYSKKPKQRIAHLTIHLSVVFLFFYSTFYLIKSVIINSTISFEINKLLTFDIFGLIGYLIIVLLLASFSFYFDKILRNLKCIYSYKEFLLVFTSVSVVLGGILYLTDALAPLPLLFFVLLGITFSYERYYCAKPYRYSTLLIIVLFLTFYTVILVTQYSKEKNNNNKKVLLTSLAFEDDPISKYILYDKVQNELKNDTLIGKLYFSEYFNIDVIINHLRNRYFSAYFDKYNMQVTVCNPKDSVYLEPPDDAWHPCYEFFQKMISERGTQVYNTDFYTINNLDGLVSYLGWFKYPNQDSTESVSVFVELTSKLTTEELGYPALLLDDRYTYKTRLKGYSYAKYYEGQLVSQFGNTSYSLSSKIYEHTKEDYSTIQIRKLDHMVYRPNPSTLIVLTSSSVTFFDLVISFSYTFLIYFIIINILTLSINFSSVREGFLPTFKNKIRFSMIGILLLSLILIGGGTLYYNVRQYSNKNVEMISEKLQSLYNEMEKKLGNESHIDPNWYSYPYSSLNELLIKLSNTFYIDVNLYDKNGFLLASSRPEIFQKGLVGAQINADAYKGLTYDMMAQVINTEHIGNMHYISAYMPFKNDENKLLAFLNVPYFTRQEEFAAEISGMIVTVINIYVILFLVTLLIGIVISRSITLPLQEIQRKFSQIKLGQKYEKINYTSRDEIGGVVNEYNRMVTELQRSVELLARSERESAWREMAKQIAHEINNPLTPMKLSVQHLQRAWADKRENFDEFLNRITKTLVDEIDNLSSIAVEFSNFAKMPHPISQKLDLMERINSIVNLFSNDEVEFVLQRHNNSEIIIYADKEQISRVFINLFKNAIQSVGKGVSPSILIDIQKDNYFVEVRIKDNGVGIPKEVQEKLFRPNFTTKSSGMGLGLAIVKKIIEDAGGIITYETAESIGTTFIIRLPLYKK